MYKSVVEILKEGLCDENSTHAHLVETVCSVPFAMLIADGVCFIRFPRTYYFSSAKTENMPWNRTNQNNPTTTITIFEGCA